MTKTSILWPLTNILLFWAVTILVRCRLRMTASVMTVTICMVALADYAVSEWFGLLDPEAPFLHNNELGEKVVKMLEFDA